MKNFWQYVRSCHERSTRYVKSSTENLSRCQVSSWENWWCLLLSHKVRHISIVWVNSFCIFFFFLSCFLSNPERSCSGVSYSLLYLFLIFFSEGLVAWECWSEISSICESMNCPHEHVHNFWCQSFGMGCSSVGRALDLHAANTALIARCSKGYFSQGQLTVSVNLSVQLHAFASVWTSKIW